VTRRFLSLSGRQPELRDNPRPWDEQTPVSLPRHQSHMPQRLDIRMHVFIIALQCLSEGTDADRPDSVQSLKRLV
jgi:hypothetical protein